MFEMFPLKAEKGPTKDLFSANVLGARCAGINPAIRT